MCIHCSIQDHLSIRQDFQNKIHYLRYFVSWTTLLVLYHYGLTWSSSLRISPQSTLTVTERDEEILKKTIRRSYQPDGRHHAGSHSFFWLSVAAVTNHHRVSGRRGAGLHYSYAPFSDVCSCVFFNQKWRLREKKRGYWGPRSDPWPATTPFVRLRRRAFFQLCRDVIKKFSN